jgi:hypothetical protein
LDRIAEEVLQEWQQVPPRKSAQLAVSELANEMIE